MTLNLSVNPSDPNWPATYWLACACREAYYSDPPRLEELRQAAGPGGFSLRATSEPAFPSACLFTFEDWAVLALAGTTNALQVALQAVGAEQVPWPGIPGRVSAFWLAGARVMQAIFGPTLIDLAKTRRIILAGHSYGGAVAVLLGCLLRADLGGQLDGVVTFGAPKTGNAAFATAVPVNLQQNQNDTDPIPCLPPGTVSWLGLTTFGSVWNAANRYYHPLGAWRFDYVAGTRRLAVQSDTDIGERVFYDLYQIDLSSPSAPHAMRTYALSARQQLPLIINPTASGFEHLDWCDEVNQHRDAAIVGGLTWPFAYTGPTPPVILALEGRREQQEYSGQGEPYEVRYFFRLGPDGWVERWWLVSDAASVQSRVTELARARAAMLCSPSILSSVRVSRSRRGPGSTSVWRAEALGLAGASAFPGAACSPALGALRVRCLHAGLASREVPLRGLPAPILERTDPGLTLRWMALAQRWTGLLLRGGWSIRCDADRLRADPAYPFYPQLRRAGLWRLLPITEAMILDAARRATGRRDDTPRGRRPGRSPSK